MQNTNWRIIMEPWQIMMKPSNSIPIMLMHTSTVVFPKKCYEKKKKRVKIGKKLIHWALKEQQNI